MCATHHVWEFASTETGTRTKGSVVSVKAVGNYRE
jgi:hypothetical protein